MTKIIQTFWNASKNNILLNAGGYLCPEIHWMGWAFSCLQLRKFYPRVEMYTNKAGKDLFELLELPYTKIHTTLEDNEFIENLMPELWAYSKIHTYSIQEEPFLHIDGDIFIWKPFKERLLNSPLIAQNLENNMAIYIETINLLNSHIDYIPDWLKYKKNHLFAYNAGIIGGLNYDFFKEYADLSFDFYKKNKQALEIIKDKRENTVAINLIFEQYLYYVLAKKKNIKVSCFSKDSVHKTEDNLAFYRLDNVPHQKSYVHMLGNTKSVPHYNNFVNYILFKEYPKYWNRIIEVFESQNQLSGYMKDYIIPTFKKNNKYIESPNEQNETYILTREICKTYNQDFNDLSDRKFKNIIVQDIYEYESEIANFQNSKMEMPLVKFPFYPFYSKKVDIEKDFYHSYIVVNPNHTIIHSRYDWGDIAPFNNMGEVSPDRNIKVFFKDTNHNGILEWFEINEVTLDFFESFRIIPTTVGDFLEKSDKRDIVHKVEMLKQFYLIGLISFSTTVSDCKIFEPTEFIATLKNNIKCHISTCLKYLLEFHGIVGYAKETINQFDETVHDVSFLEIITALSSLGVNALGVNIKEVSSLDKINLPILICLQTKTGGSFYAILMSVDNDYINIYNPILNEYEKHYKRNFIYVWNGMAILLQKNAN